MEQVLKDRKVQLFATLDNVVPMVERYEHITGNRLIVCRNESNRYWLYKCSKHVNCSFEVLFGRRRSDCYFALKRINNNKHRGVRRSSRAKDGRRWKERRAGKLASVIVHVTQTKKDPPVPADVRKTSVTLNGDAIPYSAAYRALHSESRALRKKALKDFQLIIPYLDRLKANYPGSVIGYTRDADFTLRDLHVFPEFVNESLNFVRPVISSDAAHLKGKYKGTLFMQLC